MKKMMIVVMMMVLVGLLYAQAALPLSFSGSWGSTNPATGITRSNTSTYDSGSMAKLESTGHWIKVNINDVPDKLSFFLKAYNSWGANNNHLRVYESVSNLGNTETSWGTPIADYDNSFVTSAGVNSGEIQLASTTRWVALFYTKESQNCGIDELSITKGPSTNDNDTEVYEPTTQITGSTISSLHDTQGEADDVFALTIEDQGTSDGLVTKVTNIRVKPYSTNTADWTDTIQAVYIDDGSDFIYPTVTINDAYIDLGFNSTQLNVADGGSIDVTIYLYFNTSSIVDRSVLSFMVDADDHGFTADASGSSFPTEFLLGDFHSNDFTIGVEASQLTITTQPSDVIVDEVMNPSVVVKFTDANENVDVDCNGAGFGVSLTTTGTFSGSATTALDPINGVATFSNIIYSTQANSVTITANDEDGWGNTSATSTSFKVIEIPTIIINELLADPDGSTGDANEDGVVNTIDDEFVEIVNRDGSTVDISGWELHDGLGLTHRIPEGTQLLDGQALVVFGGGTPSASIPGIVQTASTGTLSLNNRGDTVTLKDGSGNEITSCTYGTDGDNDQSLARKPDFIGDFVLHSSIITNNVAFSPGRKNVDDTPLPVTLSSFTVSAVMNSYINVEWSTASESQLNCFNVWRDGEVIGSVEATNTTQTQFYSLNDHQTELGNTYHYWLEVVELDGSTTMFGPQSVTLEQQGEPGQPAVPQVYGLYQNYPNPFNPTTEISFSVPGTTTGELVVYASNGQLVKRLYHGQIEAQQIYRITWDGTDSSGKAVASGLYFYRLQTEKASLHKKMILMQ